MAMAEAKLGVKVYQFASFKFFFGIGTRNPPIIMNRTSKLTHGFDMNYFNF